MTNSLQLNQSNPVAGLGTFAYTVTAAGIYNLSIKSFPPFLTSGQYSPESAGAVDITCQADSLSSLQSTYFIFYSADNAQAFYAWYNVDSGGTDPTPAGKIGIEVDISEDDSADTVASATRAAISASDDASPYFAVTGATSHVILTNLQYGSSSSPANGSASPAFTYSITAGSAGGPAGSELIILLKQNSDVLAEYSNPSPTEPIMGGGISITASDGDVLSAVLSSISVADAPPNAVKSIINLYQGT